MKQKFADGEIPLPGFWGGYRVAPAADRILAGPAESAARSLSLHATSRRFVEDRATCEGSNETRSIDGFSLDAPFDAIHRKVERNPSADRARAEAAGDIVERDALAVGVDRRREGRGEGTPASPVTPRSAATSATFTLIVPFPWIAASPDSSTRPSASPSSPDAASLPSTRKSAGGPFAVMRSAPVPAAAPTARSRPRKRSSAVPSRASNLPATLVFHDLTSKISPRTAASAVIATSPAEPFTRSCVVPCRLRWRVEIQCRVQICRREPRNEGSRRSVGLRPNAGDEVRDAAPVLPDRSNVNVPRGFDQGP